MNEEALKLYSEGGIYGSLDYGSPAVNRGLQFAAFLCQRSDFQKGKKTVHCLGSGNGYEAVKFLQDGHRCYVTELYHPSVDVLSGHQVKAFGEQLPYKDNQFDMYFCCEVLEHIPEENIDAVLSEVKRVSEECFFTVATRGDPPFNTHICIHNGQWWMNKFEEHGFSIINAQINPHFWLIIIFNGRDTALAVHFPDGVMINARC